MLAYAAACDTQTRRARLREAKMELEAEAKQREQARREAMRAEGRQPREPPSSRDAFAPKATALRNFTDPDSKINEGVRWRV